MMRKEKQTFNRYQPPSPSQYGDENSEDAFLKDVDKFHDVLPQPFRRINKIVCDLLDDTWRVIESKFLLQTDSTMIQQKTESILYEEELLINGKAIAMNISSSNIFITSSMKILVYSISPFKFVCDQIERKSISYNQSFCKEWSPTETFVINQLSDGSIEVLFYGENQFIVILDSFKEESENEDVIMKLASMSPDGKYLALNYSDNKNNWLSIYKLPLESWHGQVTAMIEKKENDIELVDGESLSVEKEPTFSKMQLLFKVHPPIVKPCHSSLSQLVKVFENDMSQKNNSMHILSTNYFEELHKEMSLDLLEINAKISQEAIAKVHYLKEDKIKGWQTDASSEFTSIAVWWSKSNQISFYQLQAAKEAEPANVFIHAHHITHTVVNAATNLIATALANGSVSVRDRHKGQFLGVVDISSMQTLQDMHFSTVFHGNLIDRLYISMSNGKLYQCDCLSNKLSALSAIDNRSYVFEGNWAMKFISAPLNLMTVIWKSGEILLYNEASKKTICNLELFNKQAGQVTGDHLHVMVGSKYIAVLRDEKIKEKEQSRLFLFQIDENSLLSSYFENPFADLVEEKTNIISLEDVFANLLEERLNRQASLETKIRKHYESVLQKVPALS